MDLEEFRDRTAKGLKPTPPTTEDIVYALKDMFEAKRKRYEHLGFIQIAMVLKLDHPPDRLFFDWMVSTQYDAYMVYLNTHTGRRVIFPWKEGKEDKALSSILFIPKGATKEEIEMSTRAQFVVDS